MSARIVVLDSEPVVRSVVVGILSQAGYVVEGIDTSNYARNSTALDTPRVEVDTFTAKVEDKRRCQVTEHP